MCNRNGRMDFLTLLASNSCTFEKICCSRLRSPLKWAKRRKLSFFHVEIQTPFAETQLKRRSILTAFAAKLRSVTFNFVMKMPERYAGNHKCVVALYRRIWEDITELCTDLRELIITSNIPWVFKEGCTAFDEFVATYTHLRHLRLINHQRLTNDMLQAICVSPSLESLTLEECQLPHPITVTERNNRINSLVSPYAYNTDHVISLLPALLQISAPHFSIPVLCKDYSQLTHLSLNRCERQPADTLRLIADSLIHLQDLDILIARSSTHYYAR